MVNVKFENILAAFCSPVLFSKKVSNLVSISKKEIPEVDAIIELYNLNLSEQGIKIEKMCECENRALLLVYSRTDLIEHLKSEKVSEILFEYGYGESEKIGDYLDILKNRIAMEKFPHEIGLFLGYPLEDVLGFIRNSGRNYKYCGYWKVYGNTVEAKRLFSIYDDMKAFLIAELKRGRELNNIVAQFKNKCIA